jgi:hypothetical protein
VGSCGTSRPSNAAFRIDWRRAAAAFKFSTISAAISSGGAVAAGDVGKIKVHRAEPHDLGDNIGDI